MVWQLFPQKTECAATMLHIAQGMKAPLRGIKYVLNIFVKSIRILAGLHTRGHNHQSSRNMHISSRKAFALFITLIFVWGLNWSVVKVIVQDVPPLWTSAIRSLIAAVTVFAVQCITQQFVIPKRRDIPVVLVVAVFNMIACSSFMALGLQYIGAGRSSVLGYTTPLWVIPGAWLFLKEPLPLRRLMGVVVGMCGIAVLFNPLALDWSDQRALAGNGLLLLSALSWAIAILCIRRHVWWSTPFQLLFWQMLLAGLALTLLALCLEGLPHFSLTPRLSLLLLYCGIPATALATWAMTVINSSLPASTTSLSLLATPVVGIAGSVLFLGEPVDLPLLVATCLILTGIALGTLHQEKS